MSSVALGQLAAAAAPAIEEFAEQGNDVFVFACLGFDILIDYTQSIRVTTFFDNAGNPTSANLFVQFRGTWFNSVTGKSISDNDDFTILLDFQAGTATNVGIVYALILPGQGPGTAFFVEAGKVTFDLATGEPLFASATAFDFPQDPIAFFCPAFV